MPRRKPKKSQARKRSVPKVDLARVLRKARRKVTAMTPRQRKKMLERQAESFARQDMD